MEISVKKVIIYILIGLFIVLGLFILFMPEENKSAAKSNGKNSELLYKNVLVSKCENEEISFVHEGNEKKYKIKGVNENLKNVLAYIIVKKDSEKELRLKRDEIS